MLVGDRCHARRAWRQRVVRAVGVDARVARIAVHRRAVVGVDARVERPVGHDAQAIDGRIEVDAPAGARHRQVHRIAQRVDAGDATGRAHDRHRAGLRVDEVERGGVGGGVDAAAVELTGLRPPGQRRPSSHRR